MLELTKAQRRAIETIDNNISVSAGAGSGKTRVLTERFTNILMQKGISSENILAITFTRKAAKEMRQRVRIRLREMLESNGGSFWQEQLRALDRTQISTIDSLCSKIIRENPVEAGVDPSFVASEEFDVDEFYRNETKRYIANQLQHENPSLGRLLGEYGRQALQEQIFCLKNQLEDIACRTDLSVPYQNVLSIELEKVQVQLSDIVSLLLAKRESVSGEHRKELVTLQAAEAEVREAIRKCDTLPLKKYLLTLSARSKATAGLVKTTRELVDKLSALPTDRKAAALIGDWSGLLRSWHEYYTERRSEAGIFGFAEVEGMALRILQNNKEIRDKYRNRYKYLMVDEFQDTNSRQKKLIYLLAGGNGEILRDKRLFVVGDPKQSIYRFRGADVSVFAEVSRDIEESGGVNVILNDNFRSSADILELCNEVFRDMLGTNAESDVSFQELTANKGRFFKPELRIIETERGSLKEANKIEALALAEKIKSLNASNNTRFSDIVILLPSINRAPVFAAALAEAEIPHTVIDGKGFFDRQEIKDFINLLTFLENSRNDVSLSGILRSPYFGISDEVLTLLFLNKKEASLWEACSAFEGCGSFPQKQIERLKLAVAKLQRLQKTAKAFALPELINAALQELQLGALLTCQEYGLEKLAAVKKLKAIAADFSMGRGGSLKEFLIRTQKMRSAETRLEFEGLQKSEAVTIMTIHKAKGLEFPVVFLPALHTKGRRDSNSIKYLSRVGLGIKARNEEGELTESSVLKAIRQLDDELDNEEKKRQLYVGMTRAEQRLILSGVCVIGSKRGKKAKEEWLDSLQRILFEQGKINNLVEAESIKVDEWVCCLNTLPKILPQSCFDEKTFLQIRPLKAFCEPERQIFSATSIQEYFICPRRYFYRYRSGLPVFEETTLLSGKDSITGGLPANVFGLLIHSTLEKTGEKGLGKALSLALKKLPKHLRTQASGAAEGILSAYMTSPIFAEVQALEKHTEENFCLPLLTLDGESFWFAGSIDCLLFYPDGELGIIDYKTGRPPSQGQEMRAYANQLSLYVLAAQQIYKKKVKTACLHFLQNRTKWELSADIAKEINEICKACSAISQKKEEQDFDVLPASCEFCDYAYMCPKH